LFGFTREEGVLIALAGKSSLEEVLSVTHNEDGGEKAVLKPKADLPKAKPASTTIGRAVPTPAKSSPERIPGTEAA
jgi:hypothetical protein